MKAVTRVRRAVAVIFHQGRACAGRDASTRVYAAVYFAHDRNLRRSAAMAYKLLELMFMENTPKIHECMTLVPRTVGSDIPISKASQLMGEQDIRHLPVLKEGKLVGVISDRDIKIARIFRGVGELAVEDVMTPAPYAVSPDALLDDVAAEMVKHKFGSAIVQASNGRVVGIFTAIDALRVLRDIMKKHYSRAA